MPLSAGLPMRRSSLRSAPPSAPVTGPPPSKLPDIRGEFIRDWGDSRDVDGGRMPDQSGQSESSTAPPSASLALAANESVRQKGSATDPNQPVEEANKQPDTALPSIKFLEVGKTVVNAPSAPKAIDMLSHG